MPSTTKPIPAVKKPRAKAPARKTAKPAPKGDGAREVGDKISYRVPAYAGQPEVVGGGTVTAVSQRQCVDGVEYLYTLATAGGGEEIVGGQFVEPAA
jgi:hypothetical protein